MAHRTNDTVSADLRRVGLTLLDDLDVLVERVLTKVQAAVPFYAHIPLTELRPAHAAMGHLLITWSLVEQRSPSDEELALISNAVRQRARQGIPAEANLLGIQLALGEFWKAAFERGRELNVPDAAFERMIPKINDAATATMAALLEEHRRLAEETARLDEQRRVHFLRGALLGGSTTSELLAQAVALGISTERIYLAFRARRRDRGEVHLIDLGMNPLPVVMGIIHGDLAGLVPERPALEGDHVVVGIGPPAKIEGLTSSFRLACRALETAIAFDRTGVVGLEDLGLLPAVEADADVAQALHARYIRPLQNGTRLRDELLESLRALFAHGLDVRAAARSISVHPNTLRYRLRKFGELTGADLRRTETLTEVWWAVQRDHIQGMEEPPG